MLAAHLKDSAFEVKQADTQTPSQTSHTSLVSKVDSQLSVRKMFKEHASSPSLWLTMMTAVSQDREMSVFCCYYELLLLCKYGLCR